MNFFAGREQTRNEDNCVCKYFFEEFSHPRALNVNEKVFLVTSERRMNPVGGGVSLKKLSKSFTKAVGVKGTLLLTFFTISTSFAELSIIN
jgi:hypothetical protein